MTHTGHTFPVRDKTVPLVARAKNQLVNFDLQCVIMHSNMHTQRLTTFLVPSLYNVTETLMIACAIIVD